MEIREITNKNEWEDFLAECRDKTFLQSWNWGEFQKQMQSDIWRFGAFENNELISVFLVVRITARRGTFLLIPHGPVVKSEVEKLKFDLIKNVKEKLKELAMRERADFVRISPIWKGSQENNKIFSDVGFKPGPLHIHPESSWKLNIELPEEELLQNMRKTTRYLVRQAQKDQNIEIYYSQDISDIEIFNEIHKEVVKVQKFTPFSLDYFRKEFEAFLPDNQIAIFFAKYKGQIIACSYEIFWSGICFYHHAALLPEFKKIPVSYLLQWEAIKEAKKRNCKIYDFWGYADPVKNPRHPYSGPTLFKMGFGGYLDEYVKTQDLPISPKYWLNYIIEKARKIKRGL